MTAEANPDPLVMASGIIPLLTVSYISSPFVAHIHLHLPAFARHSRSLLARYARNPPRDARLDITTMNFIGKPRVSAVRLADLVPKRERWGMVNYVREARERDRKRPWWMGHAVRAFGVHGGRGVREGEGVWEILRETLGKRAGRLQSLRVE